MSAGLRAVKWCGCGGISRERGEHLKRLMTALAALAASVFVLSGCSGGGDAALKKDVDELKASVAKLEKATGLATPEPRKVSEFKDFGFKLPLPDGLQVQTAGLAGAPKPTNDEGQLSASSGGVGMVLIWTKKSIDSKAAVQGAFELLQSSQPTLEFKPVSQGDLKVDSQTGVFGSFAAQDKQQKVAAVGAIGSWSCKGGQVYTLTVAGANQQAVEGSFAGFSSGFKCPA